MVKSNSFFCCSSCGTQTARWLGQCPGCGAWNAIVEEQRQQLVTSSQGRVANAGSALAPIRLASVKEVELKRWTTGITEFDRVLGGGIVPGSLILVGGAPGIGKSTLTTMALAHLQTAGGRTLYVSGEESAAQIKLRAQRLGEGALSIPVICDTDLSNVTATIRDYKPDVCIIDSVQTLASSELTGAPGSVGQVREVADRLLQVAKRESVAIILVGHVTKEGALAGPRVLEHLVDCVLHFEGERERVYRTLRAQKNRFGSIDDVAIFEMHKSGLVEVLDASARFVKEASSTQGSVIVAAMEGSKPLLAEVQALVSPSELVPPRRVVNGADRNRLALVLAVLGRHCGLKLGNADVFVSVVGGMRLDEPAADLAIAFAVASAAGKLKVPTDKPLVCFGELGLAGELRAVGHPERRVAEAKRFGLGPVLCPVGSTDSGIQGAKTLKQALAAVSSIGSSNRTESLTAVI